MRKSDIIPAAELLETLADKFESGEIDWTKADYGWIPTPDQRELGTRPEACLVGGLGQVAGIFTNSLFGVMAMAADTQSLVSRHIAERDDAEALRHFAVARKAAAEAIRGLTDGRTSARTHLGTIVGWNDHQDTTFEEVLDVLKHAAKDLRNQAPAT